MSWTVVVVHSASVSWSTLWVQQAPWIILLWTCNPRNLMLCLLAFLKGVITPRSYQRGFKNCARVAVVAMSQYLWMLLSAQGRWGAWKYWATAQYDGMETGQGKATAFPLRHGVTLKATYLFQLGHFFVSWNGLSKLLRRTKFSREKSCTASLAKHPASSWCSGSIRPWQTPGFLAVSVSRVLLWKPDCMCSCTSWSPK